MTHARRLQPELALFSERPRPLSVTVVTAFTTERLYMLPAMCAGWRGPISAAVYQARRTGPLVSAMRTWNPRSSSQR